MSNSVFRGIYDLSFQVSPIVLTGGIASALPGSSLPIILLMSGLVGTAQNILTTGGLSLQDFPWRFLPVSGSAAISQTVATYPFANRQIAANATIEQPRSLSMRMISPVQSKGGYITKLPAFTSLQSALNKHNNLGGTYTVVMPSLIYSDCLLLSVTDATPDSSKQKQIMWKWDFTQPLITQQQATNAVGGLMNLVTNGAKVTSSSWSNPAVAINNSLQGASEFAQTGINGILAELGI